MEKGTRRSGVARMIAESACLRCVLSLVLFCVNSALNQACVALRMLKKSATVTAGASGVAEKVHLRGHPH
jgi:hypothetical protein